MSAERTVWAVAENLSELIIDPREKYVIAVAGGVIATGKSTIAKLIAQRLDTVSISSDDIREMLFGGIQYEPVHSEIALDIMIKSAEDSFLAGDRSVVLDATFSSNESRMAVEKLARGYGRNILWIEVICDEKVARARFLKRKQAGKDHIDGEWRPRIFDPFSDHQPRIVIDNSIEDNTPDHAGIGLLVDLIFTH